jgi:hypothetical protein
MKKIDGIKFLAGTLFMVALFLLVALTSCVPAQKKTDSVDPIRNAREIGQAIGCMFAPQTCPRTDSQKREDEQKFIKEFDRIDQELSRETAPSTSK